VAPEARLLAGRVLDSDGRGDMLSVASGIYWAMEKGARVINLSLGSLSQSDMVQAALEDAENAGVVCVAAAGNWGTEYPREFPARSSHVLAVAAVDEDRQPAPFSSYGTHIAVSAPGVALRSAYVGGGYVLWSGTSMSAPLVSGSAATLIALHPSWGKGEVRKRLSETSDPLHPDAGALAAKFGSGVVNAGSALYPDRDLAMNGGEGERVNPRRR
jgi:subtilisin family serine protease